MALISHLAGREDHPACWPRVSGPRSSGPSPGTSLSGQGRQAGLGPGWLDWRQMEEMVGVWVGWPIRGHLTWPDTRHNNDRHLVTVMSPDKQLLLLLSGKNLFITIFNFGSKSLWTICNWNLFYSLYLATSYVMIINILSKYILFNNK